MEEKKQYKIKILVACHKADSNIRQDDIYMPIQVGKALHPELDLGFQCDNTGDNISEKNGSYCELTALYWAWKNLKDLDYIGLCHYRRYFDYNEKNIIKDLEKYDVIALAPKVSPYPSWMDLSLLLSMEDVTIAIINLLKFDKSYQNDILKCMYQSNKTSQCNMFIMKWSTFDSYCSFLFNYLAELEKVLKIHSYTRLRRNIGYIAENFQGVYFTHNNLKVKYVNKFEFIGREGRLKSKLREIRDNFIFKLLNKPNKLTFYNSVLVGLKNDGLNCNGI